MGSAGAYLRANGLTDEEIAALAASLLAPASTASTIDD